MSAVAICADCHQPLLEEHVQRVRVVRTGIEDGVLTLYTVTTHVDCDDPRGEDGQDVRLRAAAVA